MDLASLSPARSAGDILGGRVRLTLGGASYDVPALSIKANRLWKESLDEGLTGLLSSIDAAEDVAAILALLSAATEQLMDLLLAYDATHVLPDRDAIEDTATEAELVVAVMTCWSAANPLAAIGLSQMTTPAPPTNVSSLPTSTRRRSTAGTRRASKAS